MTCCHIIPAKLLLELARDATLPNTSRDAFALTARVDTARRSIRTQARHLAGLMSAAVIPEPQSIAPPGPVGVSVFDCAHSQNLPGLQVDTDAVPGDATARHVFAETTALVDFYGTVFGRHSIDDAGMAMLSSVHYGVGYNNAFWNGGQMTYGDGDGAIFIDLSLGNDVIGHEITHGVTQHTLQLEYKGEAGGLNESLSDCFGSMFRQWRAGQDASAADWLIGADILGPAARARGLTCLRDLRDPAGDHCLAPQPLRYADLVPGMDPHESSGPPNLAFATACIQAGGKSWDGVGQVWYRTMMALGAVPNLGMAAFADRTRAVAAELFPARSAIAEAIDAGWRRIGL